MARAGRGPLEDSGLGPDADGEGLCRRRGSAECVSLALGVVGRVLSAALR
ncbi:hypothetical protein [Streptomyces sp. NPDC059761]